jgi:hypothetical protein
MHVQRTMHLPLQQHRYRRLAMTIILQLLSTLLQHGTLRLNRPQQRQTRLKFVPQQTAGKLQPRSLIAIARRNLATTLPLKTILRKSSVNVRRVTVLTGLDKPRLRSITQLTRKLTGNRTAVTCTSFSGSTAAGGRLLRDGTSFVASAASDG